MAPRVGFPAQAWTNVLGHLLPVMVACDRRLQTVRRRSTSGTASSRPAVQACRLPWKVGNIDAILAVRANAIRSRFNRSFACVTAR